MRDLTLLSHRLDDAAVPGEKHPSVLLDAGEDPASLPVLVQSLAAFFAFIGDGLGRGQGLGMLAKPIDAVYLGADGLLHFRRSRDHGFSGAHFEFRVRTSERANSIK